MSEFCPFEGCKYSKEAGLALSKAHLNQHILLKHKEKTCHCDRCPATFATTWQLKKHKAVCGITEWSCPACDQKYDKRLSLVTHCKRHGHPIPEEAQLAKRRKIAENVVPVLIRPAQVNLVELNSQSKMDQSSATNLPEKKDSVTQINTPCPNCGYCASRSLAVGAPKAQAGTQTDPSQSRASTSAQCPPMRSARKQKKSTQPGESIETQTDSQLSSTSSKTNFAEAETTTDELLKPNSPLLSHFSNPLLSQMTAPKLPTINTEQSVQTETHSEPTFKETQTDNWGQMLSEDLFMDASINEHGTQTIWNSEIMTQTDDSFNLELDLLLNGN